MKNSSIKRNYLFGAFGGLSAVLLSASLSPAFAFTDVRGNTCDTPVNTTFDGSPVQLCQTGSSPMTPEQAKADFDQRRAIERVRQEQEDEDDDLRDKLFGPYWRGFAGVGSNFVNHLGMYVSSNGESGDAMLGGGGYSLRNGGASISDTAGLIAPGSQSASYRQNGGGGGINGTYNASRLVGPNQTLLFNGAFNYTSSNTNFGGVGAGSSINSDNYSFKGTALYANYDTYLALTGSYQFGNNTEMSSGSTGSYSSDGYHIDAAVGQIFYLLNTMTQAAPSRMALKAQPKPSDGYAIGLDLTGHLGYTSDVARGFTDTSGFIFGDERAQGGETGLRAKLFALVQNYGVTWQPYVSGSVNWRFDYSHVANFPGQLALATGDALTFADATTYVGGKVGLDVKMTNGWTVGANGFYEHSSDTEILGGKAYVKIPFGETAVIARY
jgi:hypothetical protein